MYVCLCMCVCLGACSDLADVEKAYQEMVFENSKLKKDLDKKEKQRSLVRVHVSGHCCVCCGQCWSVKSHQLFAHSHVLLVHLLSFPLSHSLSH